MYNEAIKYDTSSIIERISCWLDELDNSELNSYKEVKEMRTGLVFILALTTTTVFAGRKYLIETGN